MIDLLDRRNQFIVGRAFEYSKVKFEQSEQEIATLDPMDSFLVNREEVEQNTGLLVKLIHQVFLLQIIML